MDRPFSGSLQTSAAGFDTLGETAHFMGGTQRFGYFASATAMKTNRFLDQVSLDNLQNGGNAQRAYHLRETGAVFRASYNRNYQTPPNENLLLSSSDGAASLVPPAVR